MAHRPSTIARLGCIAAGAACCERSLGGRGPTRPGSAPPAAAARPGTGCKRCRRPGGAAAQARRSSAAASWLCRVSGLRPRQIIFSGARRATLRGSVDCAKWRGAVGEVAQHRVDRLLCTRHLGKVGSRKAHAWANPNPGPTQSVTQWVAPHTPGVG